MLMGIAGPLPKRRPSARDGAPRASGRARRLSSIHHAGPFAITKPCAPHQNGRLAVAGIVISAGEGLGTGENRPPPGGDRRLAPPQTMGIGQAELIRAIGISPMRWSGGTGVGSWPVLASLGAMAIGGQTPAAMLGIIIGTQKRLTDRAPISQHMGLGFSSAAHHAGADGHAQPARGRASIDRQTRLGPPPAWQPPRRTGRKRSQRLASLRLGYCRWDSKSWTRAASRQGIWRATHQNSCDRPDLRY